MQRHKHFIGLGKLHLQQGIGQWSRFHSRRFSSEYYGRSGSPFAHYKGHSRVVLDRSVERDINIKSDAIVVMRDYSPRRLERSQVLSDREFPRLHHKQISNSDHNDIHVTTGTDLKWFVSFYVTNVPELIPYFYLCQGFEACGC